jgi:hypothetical protein
LARLVGYRPAPGVAAGVYLAFTIEEALGALGPAANFGSAARVVLETPPPVPVAAGVKVQSVPGPGEQAQMFETVEAIEARAEWNAIRPRLTQPQKVEAGKSCVFLAGTAANLQKGDTVLLVAEDGNTRANYVVFNVTLNDAAGWTRIDFWAPEVPPLARLDLPKGSASDFAAATPLDEQTVRQLIARSWREEDLAALAEAQGWPVAALAAAVNELTARRESKQAVFAFRQRAAVFGYNAPVWRTLPAALRFTHKTEQVDSNGNPAGAKIESAAFPEDWEGRSLEDDTRVTDSQRRLDLDGPYKNITGGSWVLLSAPKSDGNTLTQSLKVTDHVEVSRSDYSVSGKISRLKLALATAFDSRFKVRNTSVLVQSESLPLADFPVEDTVAGDTVVLGRAYPGLKTGRHVILTGERDDLPGKTSSETRALKEVLVEAGFTVLVFDQPLAHSYLRRTVTLNANVAFATHGETVQEVLGSGDATQTFQSFALRQPPLTYTSAATPAGRQSTLEVRVNDVLWAEAPSFYGRGPDERIYVTREDDAGLASVVFGDGRTGARLPTGQENVRAKYRKGAGLAGRVKTDQLSQLMTRPLGVKGVTNPAAAGGAADPEPLADARDNAPLTVLTLGRVVSLQDYEDFARSFAGIAKALATFVWNGQRRAIHLTVAGAGGAAIEAGGELRKNLIGALRRFGDPFVPLTVESYQPRLFVFAAAVKVDPAFLPEKVLAAVEATLRERFSFAARSFGQNVNLSEVIALVHEVAGVVAVDVNEFYGADTPPAPGEPPVKPRLEAKRPRPGVDTTFPAQILMLDPRPPVLEVMP